jgi:hypothetical protein
MDLLRLSPIAYADGISSPATPNLLSPREISNNLNNQSDPIFLCADNISPPQSQHLSDFGYLWGQFIDHDMDLTTTTSNQSFDIPADPTRTNDPMGVEPFTRSTFDPNTGTSSSNPRQQVNADTSFLDLSQVYGSSAFVANALRTRSGGLLKTSPGNLLPYDSPMYFTAAQIKALNMANDAMQVPESSLFAAGDVRANENIELTAMQTLFVRNHNRLAAQLQALNPTWTDEQLYQEARRLNIAEEEIITYTEFLPAILGPNALPTFAGYDPDVNPSIATEFSTVGFRFGHSLLSNSVGRNQNDGTNIADVNPNGAGINLAEDFFRPDLINPNGVTVNLVNSSGMPDPHTSSDIGAILKADADGAANEMDLLLIDEVRNVLFGIPHGPGTDLAARDIQRARDDGIGTYNQVRVAFGLPAVTSFEQITSNDTVQDELQATYGTIDQIDPFEGMLAEDHLPGADVGPTIQAILADQFTRLRDGDRFFYLNESFNSTELSLIGQGNTLAKVIENNTPITNLQSNVFFFTEKISGQVYADPDGNGTRGDTDPGMPGITVNLNDGSGNVIATTTTDGNGEYDFTDTTGIPATGNFTVSLSLPPTLTQTAAQIAHNPGTMGLSRSGLDFESEDFAVLGTQVNFLNGFGGAAGLQLNGSAKLSGSSLRLTDGGNSEAASAFTTSAVNITQFSTFFSFQLTNANADGFTFTIERQGPKALGSNGGGLGYATDGSSTGRVITHSAAIKFDLFNNRGEGNDSTGLYFNGASPTIPAVNLSNTGINLHSGDLFEGRISYDGSTLTLRINDDATGAQAEVVFSGVNIPAVIGGTTAFVGFTGGTGGLTATQDIRSWNYTVTSSSNQLAMAGSGAGDGDGSTLALSLASTPALAGSATESGPASTEAIGQAPSSILSSQPVETPSTGTSSEQLPSNEEPAPVGSQSLDGQSVDLAGSLDTLGQDHLLAQV